MTKRLDEDQALLFLLGAGFNCDATELARAIRVPEGRRIVYPVVADLWNLFPSDASRPEGSIEDRFQKAIDEHDPKPLQELSQRLFLADYYIGSALRSTEKSNNCYAAFFLDFPGASFLTFNYDSLPELFLVSLRRWSPLDGYGISVEADLHTFADDSYTRPSSSFVLHLHGSLCVYTSELRNDGFTEGPMTYIKQREVPQYCFEPRNIAGFFDQFISSAKCSPYEYERPEARIIAPIPEKASQLVRPFVRAVYAKAQELLGQCGLVVAIGYDFNPSDAASYDPILRALARWPAATLVIVSPNAFDIKERLTGKYSRIDFLAFPATFRQWVEAGYPIALQR